MSRLSARLLYVAAAVLLAIPFAQADSSGKIFMFVRDGSRDLDLMLTEEVGMMHEMLEQAGYTVDIATASGDPMVSESVTLVPTVALADVNVSDYVGVILPCMAPEADLPVPASVNAIMNEAVAAGMPVAASRGSVVELAKAGGVTGKQYMFAASPDVSTRPEFAGGEFMGTGVIRDGNISTSGICPLAAQNSGKPDGTVGLTKSFIESLAETS